MGMNSLKAQSKEIRSLSSSKRRVKWPSEFKSQVVEELSKGTSGRDLSRATGISYSMLMSWRRRKSKNRPNKFKQVHIRSSEPSGTLTLNLVTGAEVKGLIFSDLCELLKRGLI